MVLYSNNIKMKNMFYQISGKFKRINNFFIVIKQTLIIEIFVESSILTSTSSTSTVSC